MLRRLVSVLSLCAVSAFTQVPPAGQSAAMPMPAASQEAAPAAATAQNTIHAVARLVVLDAVVVDPKGVPVDNIERSQFRITEDDAPQTLLNFAAPGAYTVPADAEIHSTADLDRLAPRAPVNIVLLDEFNTLFEDMAFARYSLAKWLKAQPAKLGTPTMLIAVRLGKFEVLQDYTEDKDQILEALNHHLAVYPWQAQNFSWIGERYATAFATLQRVAAATAGHPGHKNMIWIGRGLPSVFFRLTSLDRDHVNNAVQAAVNELRDARVTLYTVDPAGVQVDPSRYGEEAGLFNPFGGNVDFNRLALATGGRALYGRNDVDAEIGTSIRDGSSLYTMTYRPTNSVRDVSHFRQIRVTVDGRPDLKVITRKGYFDSRAPARLTADGAPSRRMMGEIAGAETSNMVYDAVPFTATPTADAARYDLHLQARTLAWRRTDADTPRECKLVITASVFDKKDKILKSEAKEITLTAKATAPQSGPIDSPVTLPWTLPVVDKGVRARIVVRVLATGRMGTADVDLLHPGAPVAAASAPLAGSGPTSAGNPQP